MIKIIAVLCWGCLINTALGVTEESNHCICNRNLNCFLSNLESEQSIYNIDYTTACQSSQLHNVKSLELQNSSLNEFPSYLFNIFGNLNTLKIKNAGIKTYVGQQFGSNSNNLMRLDLSHNEIKELHKNQFAHFTNIRKIDLSHNLIEMIDDDAFAVTSTNSHATETIIVLSFNQLKIFKHEWLLKLQGRTGIKADFSFNKITEIFYKETIEEDTLKYLDLSHNQLLKNENFYECMTKLVNLESLDLSYNDLGTEPDLKLETFAELTKLKEFSLAGNNFSSIPYGLLSFKKSLVYLDLSSNMLQITDLSLMSIPPLKSLKQLDISFNTYRGNFPRNVFDSFPSLTELGIEGAKSNCICLANFIKHLRRNKIYAMEPKNPVKNETNIDGIFCTINGGRC